MLSILSISCGPFTECSLRLWFLGTGLDYLLLRFTTRLALGLGIAEYKCSMTVGYLSLASTSAGIQSSAATLYAPGLKPKAIYG